MSVKNILLITNAYPDTSHPSHGIFIQEVAERLSRSDCHISVLSPLITPPEDERPILPNIHVYRFRSWTHGKRLIELGGLEKCLIPLYVVSCVVQALKIIKMSRIDILHAHWIYPSGLIACVLKKLTRVPFAITIHGTDWRMGHANKIIKWLTYHMFRQAKFVTVCSEIMLKKLHQHEYLKHKTIFFPFGIDTDTFKPALQIIKGAKQKINIISTRKFYPIYQVHLLFECLLKLKSSHPNIQTRIIGDGPLTDQFRSFVTEHDLENTVVLLGQIPHADMPAYFHQADIYISTSPFDSTSLSLLEAMACGCFPVVTDTPENKNWITDVKTGCLYSSGSSNALIKAVIHAIKIKNIWTEAQKTNWQLIREKADWNTHIAKLTSAYSELNSF